MAKRYIGIDLDGATARVAVLTAEGGSLSLDLRQGDYRSAEECQAVLAELTGGARPLGDHLVAALPSGAGYVRRLSFPFRDRTKLAAVLAAELDAQVPLSLDGYQCAMQPPQEHDGSYLVEAAAVPAAALDALLAHFPDPAQHPRRIDLLPHALLDGLAETDGLLLYCGRQEALLALIAAGRVAEMRLLPRNPDTGGAEVAHFASALLPQLEQRAGTADLPLWVCGAGVDEELLRELQGAGRMLSEPVLPFDREVPPAFLPAVLLALAERGSGRTEGFNFRSGAYAPRGQLEMLKKKLFAAAVLLVLCLLVLGGSAYVDYQQRARRVAELSRQLEQVFRSTLPEVKTIVDVPLQMRSHLQELRQQALVLGVGGGVTALSSLQTLSEQIGDDLKTDLRELSYNGEELRLDGYTSSFDAVNRLTQTLGRSAQFASIEISEAKTSADGSRVDFQLLIRLNAAGGER